MRIPFFKIGTHTAMSGETREFTAEEIDRRIALYNEQQDHQAPVVIGHPKLNDPAFGWIKRLQRVGEIAFAEVDQVQPEFAEWLKKGLFKKVSASFYGNGLLRHIGFLGAMPPAIKGLPATEFSEDSAETVEFAADGDLRRVTWSFENVRRAIQAIRDWLIEKEGVEAADKVISQWLIDGIEYETAPVSESGFADGEGAAGTSSTEEHSEATAGSEQAAVAGTSPRIAELEAQLADERAQRQALEAVTQAREARAAAEAFCDSDDLRGRITPAMRPVVIELVLATRTNDFGEGEDKRPLPEALRDVLKAIPVTIDFRERAVDGPDPAPSNAEEEAARAAAADFNKRN
jgi:hypothetical protein